MEVSHDWSEGSRDSGEDAGVPRGVYMQSGGTELPEEHGFLVERGVQVIRSPPRPEAMKTMTLFLHAVGEGAQKEMLRQLRRKPGAK